ncbi:MAG: type II toxin-antitoxin system HicB family antitoxin [Methanobacterium sp.]
MKNINIIIEKHQQGYVAYPLGLSGVLLSEGNTYQEALENIKSTIKFHLETFRKETFEDEAIIETFIDEITVNKVEEEELKASLNVVY